MSRKKTTQQFIAEARAVHGDKYDYSKAGYKNSYSKVLITCPEHGESWQQPRNHLRGYGCPTCAREASKKATTKTTEEFITEAKEIHGDKYDYSKVEYKNSYSKVLITCPKHGEFWQNPSDHTSGRGCPSCTREAPAKRLVKTTEQFIAKAKEIHGDKYDYSKVEYVTTKTNVLITCPKHGEFWQKPRNHLGGGGCTRCSGNHKPTTEEFIAKARAVHGDKYDYSKVEYVTTKTKVLITCPEHGEFWQQPRYHLEGSGCFSCARHSSATKLAKTTKEFITKARKVHGNKYDYSKVEYVNAKTEIVITCLEHGDFEQRPDVHLRHSGCPSCAIEERKGTTKEFITKARKVHGNKYDYSKVQYTDNQSRVIIICPDHGRFEQDPSNHLQGKGCRKCYVEAATKTTEQFIADAKKVHGNKYDYSKVEYMNYAVKVTIICPEHGDFEQIPGGHLRGNGCPQCAESLVSEPIFRKVLEEITSLKFPKKRPKWLRNPNTNSLLELDCYNQKTKIAFELQGVHHYISVNHWGGEETFQKVLQRDQIKKAICEEKGIHLFCIDQRPASKMTPQQKEEYYKKEIKKCLQQLPQHVKIRMKRR